MTASKTNREPCKILYLGTHGSSRKVPTDTEEIEALPAESVVVRTYEIVEPMRRPRLSLVRHG